MAKLFETLSQDEGDRVALFEELRRNLLAHTEGEQEEFYSHVRTLDEEIASKIEESLQEHQEVRKLLEKLPKALGNDEKFMSMLEELKDNVEHHVEEEEGELFPMVEQLMSEDELVSLNKRYLQAKKAAIEAIEPIGDEYAQMSKGELYEEAKAEELPGRSKMTREELEEELRNKGE